MIKVTKIKELKNGGATIYFDYNANLLHPMIRAYYKKSKCTKQMVKAFLLEAITEYVNNNEQMGGA